MIYQLAVSLRVKTGESGYDIFQEKVTMPGDKALRLDQLFDSLERQMAEKHKNFEHIVSVKVTQLHDDPQKVELPANK